MKILVLYTRLTGYWLACMRHDVQTKGNEYLIIRKAPSEEAPFSIESEMGIKVIDDDKLTFEAILILSKVYNPDLLYVAGWSDKRYLKVALYYKECNISTIVGVDNQWLGSFKQRVAAMFGAFLVKKYFTHIWVAGKPQYYFARKLGFLPKNICTGLYCADESSFNVIKQTKLNKQITFIGRLVEHKGLKVLFKVLQELIEEKELNIDVHLIGNGPLSVQIPIHERIKHTPFVNPEKLPALLENAGYFILPSLYEAWGVVIHEAVLAGLPVIATDEVGAVSDFVIHNLNGFVYEANDERKLKEIIKSLDFIKNDKYLEMSKSSKAMADKINLNLWSAKLNSMTSDYSLLKIKS